MLLESHFSNLSKGYFDSVNKYDGKNPKSNI